MSAATITRFYTAFQELDGETMASCYTPDATFSDPVFTNLEGRDVGDMWRMLTSQARDFALTFDAVTGDSAHWVATYGFPATGRRVVNDIRASFVFDGDRVRQHRDSFDLWKWTRQALGPVGLALGWSPIVQGKVRSQAMSSLRKWQAANSAP